MKRVAKNGVKSNEVRSEEVVSADASREARIAMIQALIPLGLEAVCQELQREVTELAGVRYGREGEAYRWGSNKGSVYVGDQKLRITVPRVRKAGSNEEIPLKGYQRLRETGIIDDIALRRVIHGVSSQNYRAAAIAIPETFGIARNSVSKLWIRASSKKLRELQERSLDEYDIVSIILDGKSFGDNEMIIGLGVTLTGNKVILGMIESNTENFTVCRDFLNSLVARGLSLDKEYLFIIDGGKGLRKAIGSVFGKKGIVQRCQWHKRENVAGYLPKEKQAEWRRKLQAAYEQPDYEKARKRLKSLRNELERINISAVRSLDEGFEETLTLHRLGVFEELGISFKTTNLIENVNSGLQRRTGRVTRWHTSDQRQRWVATALLEIEPRLNKLRGYKYLPMLRMAMKSFASENEDQELGQAA